jgi:hypothetical protein
MRLMLSPIFGTAVLTLLLVAAPADAATGTCDVSPGEYTAYPTSKDPLTDTSPPASTSGLSEARCLKTVRTLAAIPGTTSSPVVEDVFRDAKGRDAFSLPSYGKLFNMYPGENANTICDGSYDKGQRNTPSVQCDTPPKRPTSYTKDFAAVSTYANALDWKYVNPIRYNPVTPAAGPARKWCADLTMGCFGGKCYPSSAIKADGTLAAGATPTSETCTAIDPQTAAGIVDGDTGQYNPWDALVFDMGGLANKVAIFAVNDHGPQPCESNEYTVYLTNNPDSRELVNDPGKTGADPLKWNRANIYKIFTHGVIDNADCYDKPGGACSCTGTACTPAATGPGTTPNLEADSMTIVFTLPCGIAFRYAAFIAGYDGHSLGDPSGPPDACMYHSFDAEIDAVAGLNDDESAICPDKDGDGFPTCDCSPRPDPCDCVDDPAKDPDAKKYHPGAAQACDGPQYSCSATPCPDGTFCYSHQCLKPCAPGEFKCTGGFTCTPTTGIDAGVDAGGASPDLCVPAACGDAGVCDPGFTCVDGKCVDPCGPPTKCPVGQVCQDGKCKDPCALVKCPTGQLCQGGTCHDKCTCLAKSASVYPCKGDTPACDMDGTCVPSGCDTTACPTGQHCESTSAGPVCKGACDGVVCPSGSTCDPKRGCITACEALTTPCPDGTACKDGKCVDPACVLVDCKDPFVCKDGKCIDPGSGDLCLTCDSGSDATPDDGGVTDASSGDASSGDSGFADSGAPDKGGCGCVVVGGSATTDAAILLAGITGVLGAVARRRRRR